MASGITSTLSSSLLRWNMHYDSNWITLQKAQRSARIDLSLARALLILEVSYNGLNSHDLSELIGIDKASVSRIVNSCQSSGHLKINPDKEDSRIKSLSATPKALRLSSTLVTFFEERTTRTTASISKREVQKLKAIFKLISDYRSATAVTPFPGESRFRAELRRYIYCSGMLTRNYMDTEMTLSECQILQLLFEQSGSINLTDIQSAVKLDFGAVSRMITSMQKDGLVSRKRSQEDRRVHNLLLTQGGKRAAAKMSNMIGGQLMQILSGDLTKDRKIFAQIISKLT